MLEKLRKLCEKMLVDKGLDDERYKNRLDEEIWQIKAQDKSEYFLDLYERKVRYAQNENNLLVPYLLNIVDGFKIDDDPAYVYGDMPDVDSDFCAPVRTYLKNEWAPQRFGREYVVSICNYTTFGIKSSLIDMARVYGKDRGEVLALTTKIGVKDGDGNLMTWDKALELYPDLKKYCDANPEVADAAKKILSRNRSLGKHAGGLIISSKPIDHFIPLVRGKDGEVMSSWVEGLHGQDLGPMGFVKYDWLVITNLEQIALACKLIKERHNIDSICAKEGQEDWSDDSFLNDSQSLEMANKGDLKCIFQFDSEGIRQLVRSGGVDRFEDLVAYTSVYRPGPMDCCEKNTPIYTDDGFKSIEKLDTCKDKIGYLNSEGHISFTSYYMKSEKKVKKLLKIRLKNGKEILCSPEHKFLTEEKKYVEAKFLKEKMKVGYSSLDH